MAELARDLEVLGEEFPAPDVVWHLTVPGTLVGHNADNFEGNTLTWIVQKGELRNMRAESVRELPGNLLGTDLPVSVLTLVSLPCLCLFVLVLYFLGKFMAAGFGRVAGNTAELAINQLPIVRNIYSAVKQVSDFVVTEREEGFNRVRIVLSGKAAREVEEEAEQVFDSLGLDEKTHLHLVGSLSL